MSDPAVRFYELEEPERYESTEAPRYRFRDSPPPGRRDFLKSFGAGIVILAWVARSDAQETAGKFPPAPYPPPDKLGAWLHIGTDGKVTAFTGKVEFGQNARTSLTQAIAEELGAPLDRIELITGDTDRTPWDQGTIGSATTPNMVPQLRRAAAAAHKLLPAGDWSKIDFSVLASKEADASVGTPELRPATTWTVMGTAAKKIHGEEFVTGKHVYVSDMKLPGMMHGKVIRPDRFGGRLVRLDDQAAKALPGVQVVRDANFAGVVAPTAHEAEAAAKSIASQWEAGPQSSSKTLWADLKRGVTVNPDPAIEKALAESHAKLERTYTVPYIAHVPLEPRAALAQWTGSQLTIWTGTQRPFNVRTDVAEAFGIPEASVRIIVPDTGSGYGGKHTGETAIEAARLAKAAGKPVKLVWTREEEFTWGYFRPAGVIDVRSGVDERGSLTAWDFHNYSSGRAAIDPKYEIPLKRAEYHLVKAPLRQGSYRGLAATANHFARESQMDQMADLVHLDPLEFRLKNTKDERLRAVMESAAEKFGWAKRKPGHGAGFGLAAGFEKGGYVATCAEVAVENGKPPKVIKLTQTFECGAIINPEHLEMQIEGCMVMALGGALWEQVDFADGRVLNPRLSRYRVPRFQDIPDIEVITLNRKDVPPAGGSETPIVGVAPAIANAIFRASGDRPLNLPLIPRMPKTV